MTWNSKILKGGDKLDPFADVPTDRMLARAEINPIAKAYMETVIPGDMDPKTLSAARNKEKDRAIQALKMGHRNVKERLYKDPSFFWQMYVPAKMQGCKHH